MYCVCVCVCTVQWRTPHADKRTHTVAERTKVKHIEKLTEKARRCIKEDNLMNIRQKRSNDEAEGNEENRRQPEKKRSTHKTKKCNALLYIHYTISCVNV